MTPDDRRYTTSHEWIKIEDGIAIVGITDHAQAALGDITYVELPERGRSVEAGGEFGVVESVKAASDIYAPVAGEVSEANAALEEAPELLNSDPYEDGWIIKLRGIDEADVEALLSAQDYEAQLD